MEKRRATGMACLCVLSLLGLAWLLVFAFAFVKPVEVTVDEATLGHLALAAPAGNGTAAATSLVYNLTLVVSVHNYNIVMHARSTEPLDAELRFAGQPIARFRLVTDAAGRYLIHPSQKMVYRFTAADKVALGILAAAELARERAAGEFEMEFVVTSQFKYQAHSGRHSIRVTCPLKLAISTATSPAAFKMVVCS